MPGLTPMAPGGRWMQPTTNDAPPVYVPAKQLEAHFKRLVSDGWVPINGDPRQEMARAQEQAAVEAQAIPVETAMQARIDQLEALVAQQMTLVNRLLAQKSEPINDGTNDAGSTDSQGSHADRRSSRGKPAV